MVFTLRKFTNRKINKLVSCVCQSLFKRRCSVVHIENFKDSCLRNEPILEYKEGSEERENLIEALQWMESTCEEIPIVYGGKEYISDEEKYQVMPHKHSHRLAKFYYADKKCIFNAIQEAQKAQQKWDKTPFEERFKIWNRAADLMSTKYRSQLVAATMLGQAKTVYQAEIDAAAELIDFIRMNVDYCKQASIYQPISIDPKVTTNHFRFRGLEGFIAAISPFNFTAIGGNLAYTPALMGNSVLWKPSDTAILSNWVTFKIMREAGVPDGVVNFVPCDGPTFGSVISSSEHLSGINFTGSMATFQKIWQSVGERVSYFRNFPRLSGECGGKNFHFVHKSADVDTVVACTIRSAFEYSGQKCSACSRMYVPEKLWEDCIKNSLIEKTKQLVMGDVREFEVFTSAVIDNTAFLRIAGYIDYAKSNSKAEIIAGGGCNNVKGYFICPTIVVVKDPEDRLLTEEIFGPILSVYVYKESDLEKTMDLVTSTTKFALTGSVFAQDKIFLKQALEKFKYAAGNFYINDKSTGAVVGQQPFGGGRMSGTNDKPGGPHYVLRWTSPQAIKETFVPLTDINYPYMSRC